MPPTCCSCCRVKLMGIFSSAVSNRTTMDSGIWNPHSGSYCLAKQIQINLYPVDCCSCHWLLLGFFFFTALIMLLSSTALCNVDQYISGYFLFQGIPKLLCWIDSSQYLCSASDCFSVFSLIHSDYRQLSGFHADSSLQQTQSSQAKPKAQTRKRNLKQCIVWTINLTGQLQQETPAYHIHLILLLT